MLKIALTTFIALTLTLSARGVYGPPPPWFESYREVRRNARNSAQISPESQAADDAQIEELLREVLLREEQLREERLRAEQLREEQLWEEQMDK